MNKRNFEYILIEQTNILLFSKTLISDNTQTKLIDMFNCKYADLVVISAIIDEEAVYYDPVTMDITFATFDGFAIKEETFNEVGGLNLVMGEAAPTDLVLRLLRLGKKVRYLCTDDSYSIYSKDSPDKTRKYIDNLILIAEHGTKEQCNNAFIQLFKAIKHPDIYSVKRCELISAIFRKMFILLFIRLKKVRSRGLAQFNGIDCGFKRGRIPNVELYTDTNPLVSIVVRTYNRPSSLFHTLKSLTFQNYDNFEVIVIEDNEPTLEPLLKEYFPKLNMKYHSMGTNVGRAKAAAKGIEIAEGKYINLLDDDDYMFPEYIATAVATAEKESCDALFSSSIALEINVTSTDPYSFQIMNKRLMDFPHLDILSMLRQCLVASMAVLFTKEAYEKVGGIREDIDAHEDWSLWLRLMTLNNYRVLNYAASCFVVPADTDEANKRLAEYRKNDERLFHDDKLTFNLSAKELKQNYSDLINDLMYLKQHDLLDQYILQEYEKENHKD